MRRNDTRTNDAPIGLISRKIREQTYPLPWEDEPQPTQTQPQSRFVDFDDLEQPQISWISRVKHVIENLIFEEAPEEHPISVAQIKRGAFGTFHVAMGAQPNAQPPIAYQPIPVSPFEYSRMNEVRPHRQVSHTIW
jgi:hypothetical protein